MSSRKRTKWLGVIVISVAILALLRIVAPYALQHAGNYVLDNTEGIEGTIGDVDLNLYRGAYVVEKIRIKKTQGEQQAPLISIERLDISILWSALFRGHVVSEIFLLEPQLYILDTPSDQSEENKEITDENTWLGLVDKAVPFSIDRIRFDQGKITLRNLNDVMDKETFISEITGEMTNITNSKNKQDNLAAKAQLSAKFMGKANISATGSADLFSTKPTFDLNAEMQRLSVKDIEGLIAFYAPFDLEAGHIDGAVELAAKDGELTGYVKAGVYQLSVFSWRKDVVEDGDNPLQILFEAASDLVAGILENDESKLVATRVPIQGTIDNTETSVLSAVVAVLQNAFLQTFDMEIEDIVSFEQVAESEEKGKENKSTVNQ